MTLDQLKKDRCEGHQITAMNKVNYLCTSFTYKIPNPSQISHRMATGEIIKTVLSKQSRVQLCITRKHFIQAKALKNRLSRALRQTQPPIGKS